MSSLVLAIKAYKTEYLKGLDLALVIDSTALESRGEILSILMGEDDAKLQNPRQMRFLELPPPRPNGAGGRQTPEGVWEMRDLWGHFYRIHLDVDGDGKIRNPAEGPHEPPDVAADVIVYSAGPDGDYDTWKDNIRSW